MRRSFGVVAGGLILTSVCPFPLLAATPLGTAFTYHGRLEHAGNAVNGPVDLSFSLWDAAGTGSPPVGGNQIGSSQAVLGVQVTNGLFSVQINAGGEFGASAFHGEARWLQIAVDGTTLAPRQAITATPYALHALTSATSGGPWSVSGSNVYYNGGNVGIGTALPSATLSVVSNTTNPGDNTAMLFAPGIGPHASHIHYGATGDWYIRAAAPTGKIILQDSGGRVGVGTNAPATSLDVRGSVIVSDSVSIGTTNLGGGARGAG